MTAGELGAVEVAAWLEAEMYERGKRKRPSTSNHYGWLYPSNAGECPRRLVLRATEGEPSPPLIALGAGFIGDAIHGHIQDLVSKKVADEEPVHEERRMIYKFPFGELWGRIDTEFKKSKLIVDWKSKSDFAFGKIRSAPEPKEVAQVNLYLYERVVATDDDSWSGALVYINKAKFEIIGHEVPYDETLVRKTLKDFIKVHKSLENGTLPDKRESKNHPDCFFCPFKTRCWGAQKDEEGPKTKRKSRFRIRERNSD